MKRVFYLLSGVALLYLFLGGMLLATSCSGDSSSDPIDEPDKPEPPKNVTLELSRSDLVFESSGGEKTFTISCNGNWTIENESDWCTTDIISGTGNRTVTVNTQSYSALEDRNMNLTVKAGDKTQVLGVTQKYKDAILLSKDKYKLPQEGGTVSVEVKSNISSVTVTVPAEFQSWIAPASSPSARAVTTESYDFTVSATDSTDVRSGFIVFSGNAVKDTVYVYQAQKDHLQLVTDRFTPHSDGEEISVGLRTNVDYRVEIPASSASWISLVETRSLQTDALRFRVESNAGGRVRSVEIVVKDVCDQLSDTLYITQYGAPGDEQDIFTEIVSGVNLEMIYVKGGTFSMGDNTNGPVHSVTLSGYYIGKFEVTQGLWEKVVGTTIHEQRAKSTYDEGLVGVGSDYPMYYVNWYEAREFCTKLSQLTGRKYALPTEAQWEYAARGGVKNVGYEYSGSNMIDDVAWHGSNSNSSTHPVGTKQPNELGIYDMTGNVHEWCRDWYGPYSSESQTDPTGPSSGFYRIRRGGGWDYYNWNSGVSDRRNFAPESRRGELGFRVVLLP